VKPLFILTIIVLGVLLLVGVDETSASSLTASLAMLSVPSGAVLEVKLGCKLVDGQLICGKKNGNAGNDNGNNDQGSKKKKKNKETGSEGEHSCPEGYVVLKEENKYHSFCQATEAVKPNCAPGTVLNGEQCNCPAGTVPKNGINNVQSVNECIKKVASFATYCGVETPGPGGEGPLILFKGMCKDKGGEVMCIDCQDGGWGCCCGVWTASNPPHYPDNSCKK
jgi:hypothetical protein